ncbi:hypothetical protein AB1Y20_015819 [Prymnesium parvum]|uniref:non-specific serine/threonine protein kinase n=1 Tax=Prymnesium parvum TaxID=97485 RepID=A0AB34K1A5_PRYPA
MPASIAKAAKGGSKQPRITLGPKGKQYNPQKILGRGAFGIAYLVVKRDDPTYSLVMKRIELGHMDSKAQADAQNECKILTQLAEGPFIVHVVEHFVELERLWIVMEFADGGDLAAMVEAQKLEGTPFTEDTVLDWTVQLLLALGHAHERKVLHRDLKPQNIFLMLDGTVRLGDFGISRVLSSTMSVVNTCVGTPLYLAPEICSGESYDDRCDVWSLGVLLFELCALEHPFKSNVMPALVLKICQEEAAPLPEPYSDELRQVSARLLYKDPSTRPHVHELLNEPPFAPRVHGLLAAHEESRRKAALREKTTAAACARPPSARPKSRAGEGASVRAADAPSARPKSRAGPVVDGGVNMTRSAELRHEMHGKVLKPDEREARKEAAKEAAAKRDAMREQIRKDRLAAKQAMKGNAPSNAGLEEESSPYGELSTTRKSSLYDLVVPKSTDTDGREGTAPHGARPSDLAALRESFPHGKVLTEQERALAKQALEKRHDEVREAMQNCTTGGQAGRTMLNNAQRELVTISRMKRTVEKRYVVVMEEDVEEEGDGLSASLRDQVGVISAADLAEAEGDADGLATELDGEKDIEASEGPSDKSRACLVM